MRLRRALWFLGLASVALSPPDAGATTIKSATLEETIEWSHAIVTGEVLGQRVVRSGGDLITRVQVRVEESLRGPFRPGDRLVVSAFGGALGDRRQVALGEALYEPGERVLLQLEAIDGRLHTLGLAAGKWNLVEGADGEEQMVRSLEGLALVGGSREMTAGPLALDEFRGLVLSRPPVER